MSKKNLTIELSRRDVPRLYAIIYEGVQTRRNNDVRCTSVGADDRILKAVEMAIEAAYYGTSDVSFEDGKVLQQRAKY